MIAQSRFLARDARVAVDEGNATLGTILALAGLPSDLGNPDRPFIDDAEDALEDAFANRRESVILKGHDEAVAWRSCRPMAPSPSRSPATRPRGYGMPRAAPRSNTCSAVMKTYICNSAAFSPDGKRVVTASNDKTARLWDVGNRRHDRGAFAATTISSISAEFSSGRRRQYVTASDDKTARVWDGTTGAFDRGAERTFGLDQFRRRLLARRQTRRHGVDRQDGTALGCGKRHRP